MLACNTRFRSASILICLSASLAGLASIDGLPTSSLGFVVGVEEAIGESSDECGDVGCGLRAAIEPGEERYAESWVICDSVNDATVARSCSESRAHSRFAVS